MLERDLYQAVTYVYTTITRPSSNVCVYMQEVTVQRLAAGTVEGDRYQLRGWHRGPGMAGREWGMGNVHILVVV